MSDWEEEQKEERSFQETAEAIFEEEGFRAMVRYRVIHWVKKADLDSLLFGLFIVSISLVIFAVFAAVIVSLGLELAGFVHP